MKKVKLDKVVSKMFFSPEEYSFLKHKNLSFKDYKSFIESCNRRIAKELVVGTKQGWEMPCNLGRLQIHKNFNMNGCTNKSTGEVYHNFHSLGYVYKCRHFRSGRRSFLATSYTTMYGRERMKEVPTLFYKWNNHRANIDRYMTEVINNNIMDYDVKKD